MNKATIALGIVGMLALPAGFAATLAEDVTAVTGHTIFVDASGFDPDIALIAGLASSKVVWFNGVIVINNFDGGYVYATEAGDCDPTEMDVGDLTFADQDLSFRDPNQVFHVVSHYTYDCGSLALEIPEPVNETIGLLDNTAHVWITATHNRTFDAAAEGDYNFATGVDIRFFNGNTVLPGLLDPAQTTEDSPSHDGTGGDNAQEIREGDSYNAYSQSHTYNETDEPHTHNSGNVDLWFSKTDLGGQSDSCVTQKCLDRQNATVPQGNGD